MHTIRHQAPIASPLTLLSLCPPRGTRHHSQIRLALSWMPHTQSTAAVPVPPCSCTKRTAALPWRGPDHCSRKCSLTHRQCRHTSVLPSSSTSQHFGCQHHRHRNILIALSKRSHSVDTVNLVTHRGICDTLLAHSCTLIRAVERESSVQPLFSCGPSAKLSCLIDIVSWLLAFCTSL